MAKCEKEFQVTAIDISPRAIEYAEKNAWQAKGKIKMIVQKFVNLPFGYEELILFLKWVVLIT